MITLPKLSERHCTIVGNEVRVRITSIQSNQYYSKQLLCARQAQIIDDRYRIITATEDITKTLVLRLKTITKDEAIDSNWIDNVIKESTQELIELLTNLEAIERAAKYIEHLSNKV